MDRRQYFRQFLIILSGNSAAQAVNLLSYPFLGRLYTPKEFGIFAMFVVASTILGAVACGRFDLVMPTAPRWGRLGVLWLSCAISVGLGVLSIAGAAVYWHFSGRQAGFLLPVLLGLSVALTGITATLSMFLMRHDRYRAQAASVLMRTGAAVITQVALGFFAATALSLILGFVFGLVAQAILLAVVVWRRLKPGPPRMRDMKAMFQRYRTQVTLDIPSTLVAAFSNNLLTLLLAGLYDTRTVGLYSLGNRLAIVPLYLFNEALGQTFFQKAARARETKGHFWDEMKFGLATSAALSVAVLAAIVLLARPFVTIYLGKQWAPAADMLVILAPMLAMRSLTMSIVTTVFVLRSVHWLFIHNVANVLVALAAYAIAETMDLSPLSFLEIASALLTIEYALFAVFLVRAAHRSRRDAITA